jgi:hypothetical protein
LTFGQFHGGAHRRRGRHPIHGQQLLEAHMQQPAQPWRLAVGGHLAVAIQPAIQLAPLADGPIGQFRGEAAV